MASEQANVALITGAADRLGAAMASRLARAGYAVVIHYRNSIDDAEALAERLADTGARVALERADLTIRRERSHLMEKAALHFGALTALVNNASVFEPDSLETLDEDLWDLHFALHAEAPLFLARDFARQLPETASGNIVNMIDERVWRTAPAYASYTLSKTTLWNATRTMAQEFAPRIRVNAIGPGPTLPHARQTQAEFDRAIAELPLRRGPTPEEIADGLMFLLNMPSMTGQMLALDGGEHLVWPSDRGITPRKP